MSLRSSFFSLLISPFGIACATGINWVLVVIAFCVSGPEAQEEDQVEYQVADIEHEHISDQILWVKSLRELSNTNLVALSHNNQPNICLYAAWELARRNATDANSDHESADDGRTPAWFAGMVEAKLGVELPSVWRKATAEFLLVDGDCLPAISQFYESELDIVWDSAYSFWRPKGIEVRVEDEQVLLSNKNQEYSYRHVGRQIGSRGGVACHFSGSQCFLVSYERDFRLYSKIIALDTGNSIGNRAWEKGIWASGPTAYSTGRPKDSDKMVYWANYVSLKSNDKSIVVFGVDSESAYFEAFRRSDGKRIASFDSSVNND